LYRIKPYFPPPPMYSVRTTFSRVRRSVHSPPPPFPPPIGFSTDISLMPSYLTKGTIVCRFPTPPLPPPLACNGACYSVFSMALVFLIPPLGCRLVPSAKLRTHADAAASFSPVPFPIDARSLESLTLTVYYSCYPPPQEQKTNRRATQIAF